MLSEPFPGIKQNLRTLLLAEGTGAVLPELKKRLPADSPKFSTLLQLQARLTEINLKRIRHLLSDEQLTLQYDQLRFDLIAFLDDLREEDFSLEKAAEAAKKAKTGNVLYRIPHSMELMQETKCVVRLAFNEAVIVQNIELTADTTLKAVRVSEAMEVTLLDPRGGENFDIRTLSTPEQFLDRDDYSEWIFYVTPQKEGSHALALKVSVLELVSGKERKKEIVLEEIIQIKAAPVEAPEEAFRLAGYSLDFCDVPDFRSENKPGGMMNFLRRYSLLLGALLIAFTGAWALGLPQELAWQWAKWQKSSEGFENYLESYPEGRHVKKALENRDFQLAVETRSDSLLVEFLVKNPGSQFVPKARQIFVEVSKANLDSLIRVRTQKAVNQLDTSNLTSQLPAFKDSAHQPVPPLINEPKSLKKEAKEKTDKVVPANRQASKAVKKMEEVEGTGKETSKSSKKAESEGSIKSTETVSEPSEEIVEGFVESSKSPWEEILSRVELMPEYPGGPTEMLKFISSNLRYPAIARDMGIEGTVAIQFVVKSDGSISGIEVLKDIGGGCAEEAIRVVKLMPAWKPGRRNGENVNAYFTVPVKFKLE